MSSIFIRAHWYEDDKETNYVQGDPTYVVETVISLMDDALERDILVRRINQRHADMAQKARQAIADALAAHYSAKFNGVVTCMWDRLESKYHIRGDRLPSHPDLNHIYPKGWSLSDYIEEKDVDAILKGPKP